MKNRKLTASISFLILVLSSMAFFFSCNKDLKNPVQGDSSLPVLEESFNPYDFVLLDSTVDEDLSGELGKSSATTTPYRSTMTLNRKYHYATDNIITNPKDYTWNYSIVEQPKDKNGNSFSNSDIETAIQTALSIWSSACGASFTRTTSSTASLKIAFKHHYGGGTCSARGTGGGGFVTLYCFTTCDGVDTPIPYGVDYLIGIVLHEAGHVLGLEDMRRNGCYNNYDLDDEYAKWDGQLPASSCMYDGLSYATFSTSKQDVGADKRTKGDPTYYSWRIGFAGTTYDKYKDSHVSIMDYDYGHTAWGWKSCYSDPDNSHPGYPSAYDVELVRERFGNPEYVPLMIMYLTKDRNGVDYGGTTVGNGYATTSWDDVNRIPREFGPPNDLSHIAGLIYREYPGANFTSIYTPIYRRLVSTGVYKLTREAIHYKEKPLGWIRKSTGTMSMQIGTKVKDRPTIPLYQYYNLKYKRYNITTKNYGTPSGWTREILGYIVPSSELINP
jgi:hypothetical protein